MMQKRSRLSEEYRRPLWVEITQWFLRLPRLLRIIGVAVIALAVVLSVSPLVDYIYLMYFFTEETIVLPSLVTAAIGILTYILGWWLLVGTVGELRPARRLVLVYLVIGFLALCLVLALTVTGYSTAVEPI